MALASEPCSTTTMWPWSGETMASSWPLEPRLPTWVTSSVSDRPQLSAATGHTWLSCLLKMSIVPSSLRFRTWISPAARANGVASGSGPLVVLPSGGNTRSNRLEPTTTATTSAPTSGA